MCALARRKGSEFRGLDSVSISEEGGRGKFFFWLDSVSTCGGLDRTFPICRLPPTVPPPLHLPTSSAELLDTLVKIFGVSDWISVWKNGTDINSAFHFCIIFNFGVDFYIWVPVNFIFTFESLWPYIEVLESVFVKKKAERCLKKEEKKAAPKKKKRKRKEKQERQKKKEKERKKKRRKSFCYHWAELHISELCMSCS